MTVKELKELLEKIPDDYSVCAFLTDNIGGRGVNIYAEESLSVEVNDKTDEICFVNE